MIARMVACIDQSWAIWFQLWLAPAVSYESISPTKLLEFFRTFP